MHSVFEMTHYGRVRWILNERNDVPRIVAPPSETPRKQVSSSMSEVLTTKARRTDPRTSAGSRAQHIIGYPSAHACGASKMVQLPEHYPAGRGLCEREPQLTPRRPWRDAPG